ncbi:MAG: transposase, partial [Bdellovibrionota bacterium]
TMAVEAGTRRILGFEVARMPSKGRLAHISRKKYGPRKDERSNARKALFKRIAPLIKHGCMIKSDESPHYPKDVAEFFPESIHQRFKGKRGCIVGQGELKKVGYDPLFSLNHTYAKLRADINRLARRTWCTTKKPERLEAHIALYVHFHNSSLRI